MFAELFVQIPDTPNLNNSGFPRRLLAKILDPVPDGKTLFAPLLHRDAEGRSLSGLSPFRIGARHQRLWIAALGEAAVSWLAGNSHRITAALSAHFSMSLLEERLFGSAAIRAVPGLRNFAISSLAWQSKSPEEAQIVRRIHESGSAADLSELAPRVERVIREGIGRQCDLLGIDEPEDGYSLGDVVLSKMVPVNVHGTRFVSTLAVQFRANLELVGPWHVGHLCARNYGHIRPTRISRP